MASKGFVKYQPGGLITTGELHATKEITYINDIVWNTWTTGTASTTVTYDLQADRTWYQWNTTASTTTGFYVNDEAWVRWNQMEPINFGALLRPPQYTVEDLAQMERERASRAALRAAQEAEYVEKRVMAASRALELLDMILTPDQRQERKQHQRITIQAPSGRRYEVETHRASVHGNIVEIDAHGCRLRRGCVAPGMYGDDGALPTADGWVGQVLALRHNEAELLVKTNWSNVQQCRQPDVPILERAA